MRDANPPIPDGANDEADAATYVRSDSGYELPPYIAPRAVKRTQQSKRKAKKAAKSAAKARSGATPRSASSKSAAHRSAPAKSVAPKRTHTTSARPVRSAADPARTKKIVSIALAGLGGLIVLCALVFLPTIRFAVDLLSGSYDAAASVYENSVGSSRLQSPLGEKVVAFTAERALNRFLSGEMDYDAASAQLDGIARISAFTAAANEAKTELTQQYESQNAYTAAQEAMARQDYETAVEQYQLVAPVYKYYEDAASRLADAEVSYRDETLTLMREYTASADFEPLFARADKALVLLGADEEIQRAYDDAESAFYNYVFNLMRQSVLGGDYEMAGRMLTNAAAACPAGERIAELCATYGPYLAPQELLNMTAVSQTALDSSASVLSNYMAGADADNAGRADYGYGLVLRAPQSDSFSRTYALNGEYEELTARPRGCRTAAAMRA